MFKKLCAASALIGILALAGCGGRDKHETQPSPSTTSAPASAAAKPQPCPKPTTASVNPKVSAALTDVLGDVTAVGASKHECGESVDMTVIATAPLGAEPQVHAQYVPGVYRDTAGNPVNVQGSAVLAVDIKTQGSCPAQPNGGTPDYVFPDLEGWMQVREVHCLGTAAGETHFAVGLTNKYPYDIFVSEIARGKELGDAVQYNVSVVFYPLGMSKTKAPLHG